MRSIEEVLSAASPDEAIGSMLVAADRFTFIEALRQAAVRSYKDSVVGTADADLRHAFVDQQTILVHKQFVRLDSAIINTLDKDGARQRYFDYSPEVNLDLPADPNSLKDPLIAYRYAMMRLYRRQFDVTMGHERKDGCWPLLCYDLLEQISPQRMLIVDQVPESVLNHASTEFVNSLDRPSVNRLKRVFTEVRDDAGRRLADLDRIQGDFVIASRVKIVKEILRKVWELGEKVLVVTGLREVAIERQEAAEKAERDNKEAERKRLEEEAEAKRREAKERVNELRRMEIPNGSGHMDRFEKNRDWIGGLA